MTRLRTTEVLVVGAGPTGLTLASVLRRLGVDCVLIDKSDAPSRTSKAIGLQYRVSELLTWMGLCERFRACAARQSRVDLYADGQRLARLDFGALRHRAGHGAFQPQMLIVPQSETERLLGEGLTELGGAVEWATALQSFQQSERAVEARLSDGQTVHARYLVSCEGAHSVARKQAQIDFAGKTYPQDFIMADVEMDTALARGQGHSWLHPDGVVTAITLPGPTRWRLFIEAQHEPEREVTLERVQAIYAQRTGDAESALRDPSWLTRFRLHCRMVERFRAGRLFLAGDAAHLHSPSGGQGITTGMQDAYNLGWKLAQVLRAGAPDTLLDSYDRERRPAARAVLATTDRNTRVFFATGAIGKWLRNRVFMPLLDQPPVQRRLLSKLSQLDMNYRASPLSLHAARPLARARVRAGDRAPDILLGTEHGGVTSLFEQLGRGRWVAWGSAQATRAGSIERARAVLTLLHSLGVETHWLASGPDALGGELRDLYGDARRLYGVRGEGLILIRPDGYVGLVSRPIRAARVQRYLARLWGPDLLAAAARHPSTPVASAACA